MPTGSPPRARFDLDRPPLAGIYCRLQGLDGSDVERSLMCHTYT